MRRWHIAAAAALAVAAGGYTWAHSRSAPKPTPSPSATACDPSFERFTYHPARLKRLKDCVTITGTVVLVRHEADGDDHVQFQLDAPYLNLMNAANSDSTNRITGGYFVIEPDCVGGAITQQDAKGPCQGATSPPGFGLLVPGAHLKVSGPYVLDSEHGHNEVHPLESISPA